MNAIIPPSMIEALSWTIVHSIWQGALVFILLYLTLNLIPEKNAIARYRLSLGALTMMGIFALLTFTWYYAPISQDVLHESSGDLIMISGQLTDSILSFSFKQYIGAHLDFIFQIWFIGAVIFSLRFLLGFGYLKFLTLPRNTKKFNYLDNLLFRVKNKTGFFRDIKIFASNKIITPIVVGWIKPTILIPIAIVNQLSAKDVETIIAHEIAHIKRHDWIVNIFQSFIEVIFYFHPATWWISAQIRQERENACDDWALQNGYDRLDYVKLMCRVKEIQNQPLPTLALGFSPSKNNMVKRIQRILGNTQKQYQMKNRILAFGLLLAIGLGYAFTKSNNHKINIPFLSNEIQEIESSRTIDLPRLTTQNNLDTIPSSQGKSKISIMQNGQSMMLEKENGNITRMEIDGKEIDPSEYDLYLEKFGDLDFGDRNGFRFKNGQDLQFFDFGNKNMWKGFNDEDFSRLFKNMDSLRAFNFNDFNFNFEGFDSLDGRMMDLNKLFEGLGENMPNFDFDFQDLDRLRNFNFDHDFDFGEGFDFDRTIPRSSGKISDKIGQALNQDGLLIEGKENKVELTGKHLKINGEKQPSNIHQKYKKMFEEYSGIDVTKDSKIDLMIEGKKPVKRGLRRI